MLAVEVLAKNKPIPPQICIFATMPQQAKINYKPKEGEDYYIENGFLVFTAYFLQKRGYCCQSRCRHCPYGFHKPKKTPSSV